MRRISDYVSYIEGLEAVEEDDTACIDNRLLLEKAWQIIANEFYDAQGRFSQASWAEQLLGTLKVCTILPHRHSALMCSHGTCSQCSHCKCGRSIAEHSW